MQRFQHPYNLKAIPEVQEYLNVAFENARHHGDLADLYRRRYVNIWVSYSFLTTGSQFAGRTKATGRYTAHERRATAL
jgi:hypothetical protein